MWRADDVPGPSTLKGPLGNLVTLSVSEDIERINEIKPGDTVEAEYLTFLRADFRAPTAAEKAVPLVVLVEAGKAPKDVAPAGAVIGSIRMRASCGTKVPYTRSAGVGMMSED
jgi:hypothetical protein